MEPRDRIILALDVPDLERAGLLLEGLATRIGWVKVGLELLTAVGTRTVVNFIHGRGFRVFLDGKFCDIPNTVGRAAKAAADHGVEMFNVHASAGLEAMRAAVANKGNSKVLAVTVLTSLGDEDTEHIFGASASDKVLDFALDAKLAGCDGVICSPKELGLLAQREYSGLLKVTPGVRPTWAAIGDQKRVMTPGEAIALGADYLVIGRPITNPLPPISSPAEAARLIAEEIGEALQQRTGN